MSISLDDLSPREIVAELDKYIIGQDKAKKAVAIAIRNRTRRQKLPADLRDEVAPKNIILIGPTGVGKTEIARRISKLSGAPFIKVEATKYTEVGYVGRDVESMVRDLMHVGVNMVKLEMQEAVRPQAEERAEEHLLDILLGTGRYAKPSSGAGAPGTTGAGTSGQVGPGNLFGIDLGQFAVGLAQMTKIDPLHFGGTPPGTPTPTAPTPGQAPVATTEPVAEDEEQTRRVRDRMREKLRDGQLDDRELEVSVASSGPSIEIFSGGNLEDMDLNLGGLSNLLGGKRKKKTMQLKAARLVLIQEELDKLVDTDRIAEIARERVQNMGIIFIDEIDKIASRSGNHGADVSREGVQRDILPIVEGSQVNTKYGLVDTRHILFIAAGAFHMSKPSDLIPELQGRFPIRVELESLSSAQFVEILTRPANALTRQYTELLATEGVSVTFTPEALALLAEMAADVNSRTENIGARRLMTVMELLLEELSFAAPELAGQSIAITPDYVRSKLSAVTANVDVSRYIL